MRRILLSTLAAAALVLGGCSSSGSEDGGTTTAPASDPAETTAPTSPEPLDDQTPPASINGLTTDGDTLWIASIEASEVLQVDRSSGEIVGRWDTGSGPDDVALAPDGSVWVTGFVNGDLGRIADGDYEVVANLGSGINPIDVDDDGTVWVGTFGPDGVLFEIEPDATAAPDADLEPVVTGLPDINGFEVLDDGAIFSPAGGIGGPGSAILIDPASGQVTTVVADLPGVAAATLDPEGTPHLLANATGELFSVDIDAGTATEVRTIADGAPFDNLAFADDGTLYLASFLEPVVTVVEPDGTTTTISIGT